MSYAINNIFRIAWREFYVTTFNPIVLSLLCIGFIFIFANGAYGRFHWIEMQRYDTLNDAFISGYRGVYGAEMIIFAIISGFIGVLSISEERGKGSMKVLLSKPVYKTDIILGKITGLGMFTLSLAVILHLSTGLLLMIYFREPHSIIDYLGRLVGFILSSFLESMLILGISMFIGTVVRNVMLATATIAVYIFLDFIGANIGVILIMIPILPSCLLNRVLVPINNVTIFDSTTPVVTWFALAAPHITLMGLAAILIILVECVVFSRQEELE